MRGYECYKYHLINKELVANPNTACWAGLDNSKYLGKDIYIDEYIEPEITDKQRKRIVYLLNKITPCKFTTIKNVKYIHGNHDDIDIILQDLRNRSCRWNITGFGCFLISIR